MIKEIAEHNIESEGWNSRMQQKPVNKTLQAPRGQKIYKNVFVITEC